jgi:hypothetical protein
MTKKIILSIIIKIAIIGNAILMLIFLTDLMTIYIPGGFPHIVSIEVNYIPVVWTGAITSTLSMYYLLYKELAIPSLLLQIQEQMIKNPKYCVRLCYNETGEVIGPKGTVDIFNNLEECLYIFKNKI